MVQYIKSMVTKDKFIVTKVQYTMVTKDSKGTMVYTIYILEVQL